jgi:hypothetical protein
MFDPESTGEDGQHLPGFMAEKMFHHFRYL